jgi:hypothetical protein
VGRSAPQALAWTPLQHGTVRGAGYVSASRLRFNESRAVLRRLLGGPGLSVQT